MLILDAQIVLIVRTEVCKFIIKNKMNFNNHKLPPLGHLFSFYFPSSLSFFFVPIKILLA